MTIPQHKNEPYVLTFNEFAEEASNARKGEKKVLEVDVVIGADGANSRVAKDIWRPSLGREPCCWPRARS